MKYLIRQYAKYWKYQPLARVLVRGMMMGIYRQGEEPFEWLDLDYSEDLCDSFEEALEYLNKMQKANGNEREPE